ncbi:MULTISPECIES: hypothetical protein [unclassified Curtobacterium]|uniref:hypothetical protein n=1 Tax=unclassified Curtobacterium TaxID=257496 RepID=UPI0011140728|nr:MULTISPECIES: hypothetical protein [unclassified Curtobacterium]
MPGPDPSTVQPSAGVPDRRGPHRSGGGFTADLVVSVVLFVLTALLGGIIVVVSYLVGAVSQYGCGWESSTRACNDAAGPQTAIVEAVVVVSICVAGALLAARVRRTRPLGWAVALGTAAAVVLAFVITWSVLGSLAS